MGERSYHRSYDQSESHELLSSHIAKEGCCEKFKFFHKIGITDCEAPKMCQIKQHRKIRVIRNILTWYFVTSELCLYTLLQVQVPVLIQYQVIS